MSLTNNYLVTRDEMITIQSDFPNRPGQTLPSGNKIISNREARDKICCQVSALPANPTYPSAQTISEKVPVYQEYVKTYIHTFIRYSATSCIAACPMDPVSYWSECSVLSANNGCNLYTDCQLINLAPTGYYVNASNDCFTLAAD